MIVASLTSGAKSTLMCPVTHGPGGTALLLPMSILLGARNPGSLVLSAGMLPFARTLTTLRFIYPGRFLTSQCRGPLFYF